MSKLTKTDINKKAMIKALEKCMGIASTACKMEGICRTSHYEWIIEDEQYRKDVESVQDMVIDFAESSLHRQIEEGNPTSTIFYLKTKGKKRGFVEKTEIEHSGAIESTVTTFALPENSRDE